MYNIYKYNVYIKDQNNMLMHVLNYEYTVGQVAPYERERALVYLIVIGIAQSFGGAHKPRAETPRAGCCKMDFYNMSNSSPAY